MESCELLITCGFTKPAASLTLKDVPQLTRSISFHCTLLKVKAELDEMCSGLRLSGVLEVIQDIPDLFRNFLVYNRRKLTAGKLLIVL